MRPRRSVEDWRRAVFGSRSISDKVRVLLLYLADRMDSNRKVSVPRSEVAVALGVSERRVSERVTDAHAAGFLVTVTHGQKGVTAVYQGTWPDPQRDSMSPPDNGLHAARAAVERLSDRGLVDVPLKPAKSAFSGTYGGPTITTADLSASGADRYGSTKEEAQP